MNVRMPSIIIFNTIHTVLSGVYVPVLIIEKCAFFARESPRYLYSWRTTQRELKRCKLGTSKK